MINFELFVGIDPGKQTGFALQLPKVSWLGSVYSVPAYLVYTELEAILKKYDVKKVLFILEDANLDSAVYFRKDLKLYKGKAKNAQGFEAKVYQNVGQVKARCRDAEEALKSLGANYCKIAPSKRVSYETWAKRNKYLVDRIDSTSSVRACKTMLMPTKMTAKAFKVRTGYKNLTNEHGRDAATLIDRLTVPKANLFLEMKIIK